MSRLTCKYDDLNALRELCTFDRESDIDADDCQSCEEYCKRHCDYSCKDCAMQKAFDKLAEYEDLEEQGLLLKLPCKIGTTVYLVDPRFATSRRKVMECYIDEYTVDKYGCYAVLSGNEPFYMLKRFTAVNITDFGETVFLTKEEAEEALKEKECAE